MSLAGVAQLARTQNHVATMDFFINVCALGHALADV